MWPFTKRDPYIKPEGDRILMVRVRTDKHGDLVTLRLSKGSDFSQADRGAYYLRKEIISSPSLDKATLEIWLRPNYSVLDKAIVGGTLVPHKEW